MYPTLKRLKPGMDAEAVVTLQERLIYHGAQLEIDGDFGEKTEAAVEQFQASHGLTPDGVVGPDTWRWLEVASFSEKDEALVETRRKEILQEIDLMGPGIAGPQREVLRWAARSLGFQEQPDGSNRGPDIDDIVGGYYSAADEERYGAPPWCALFASWCIRRAVAAGVWANTPMGTRFGAASQFEKWAKQHNVWLPAGSLQPEPGALFVMGRGGSSSDAGSIGAGHVGFVLSYDGGVLRTIDGNVRNAVSEATRPEGTLRGYAHWWKV